MIIHKAVKISEGGKMLQPISWNDFVRISSPQYYTLLITSAGEKINLTGISWYTIVSWQPPMIAVSIRSSRYGYELLQQNGDFSIAFPSSDQVEGAQKCGLVSGRKVDKVSLTGFKFRPADKIVGFLLENCTAILECRKKNEIPAGDHQLILADVLAAHGDFNNPAHLYTTAYSTFYALDEAQFPNK